MKDTLDLKCEKCGCHYQKPSVFQKYLLETKFNVFWKWSLSFCDNCRRSKEREALKALPFVINNLNFPE